MEENQPKRRSIFFPLLLVVLGILLLLNSFNLLPGTVGEYFTRFWPVLIIVGALDSLYKKEGIASPLVSIGLGGVFLLSTLGYIAISPLALFLRVWPILLVGWGFDLLFKSSSIISRILAALAGLGLIVVLGWLAIGTLVQADPNQAHAFKQPMGGIEQGEISLSNYLGTTTLKAKAADDSLIAGSYSLIGTQVAEPQYKLQGKTGYFTLKPKGVAYPAPFAGGSQLAQWEFGINPAVPVTLQSDMAIGNQSINLSGLSITSYTVNTTLGKTNLNLPADPQTRGNVEVNIGSLNLTLPAGSAVIIDADLGLVSVNMPEGFVREKDMIYSPGAKTATAPLQLKLEMSMGILNITYNN